eukprot:Blabericola_migrator_1__4964@NODE_2584_length_2573_cov_91_302075_g1617_i0_p4_GENE_NODE_2584_length_2573_cov_91_302075_g1617_i0NODE_2584_length_2573_cov_91_302075_g1617_i0_p4_ORF_typecomplete_len155_score14_58T2SSM/PF04612_12/0_16_NODE_2584_length_2573_cov_91_302075_g1617_i05741038
MLVLIALSGVVFLAFFHLGYFVIKFFEALVRDTKKEQEQRDQAEKLLAEFAAETIKSPESRLDSYGSDDQGSMSFGFTPGVRARGFTGFMQRRKLGDGDGLSDVALSTLSEDRRSKSHSRSRPSSPSSTAPLSELGGSKHRTIRSRGASSTRAG